MKKPFFIKMFAFTVISVLMSVQAFAAPSNSAHAAILVCADTGEVLFEQNADEQMLIASTTKIMTAHIVLQNCDLSEKVTVTMEHCSVEGSSMYLQPGGDYTVEQLLYGMMLASGNDAALALACHVGGDVEGFAALMNQEAERLGLQNSHFINPHGLDADGHYSCARDLAIITAAAMENDIFTQITSTYCYTMNEQTYVNHNKLLQTYDGALGTKTGYTQAAGRSLVSCAERDGLRLICVTISDRDDWDDHVALFDWGFESYTMHTVLTTEDFATVPVISGICDTVGVAPREELSVFLPIGSVVQTYVNLPRFVYAPVESGTKAGSIEVYVDGELYCVVDLIFTRGVASDDSILLSPWERFKRSWQTVNKFGYTLVGE